jgi:S-adenosylmethionine synthetase
VGYTKPEYGFDGDLIGVISSINEQSPEIALCIASEGAGDSAIVVGYATDETESFLPAPIYLLIKSQKPHQILEKKV